MTCTRVTRGCARWHWSGKRRGATTARGTLLTAGVAGLAAGAVSMALGEYVSVSSQRDAERRVSTCCGFCGVRARLNIGMGRWR